MYMYAWAWLIQSSMYSFHILSNSINCLFPTIREICMLLTENFIVNITMVFVIPFLGSIERKHSSTNSIENPKLINYWFKLLFRLWENNLLVLSRILFPFLVFLIWLLELEIFKREFHCIWFSDNCFWTLRDIRLKV